MSRISSLDVGYETGDLSVYPEALDDKEILYEAKNNAKTTLKQALSYNAKFIIVDDASSFPEKGLIRIGSNNVNGNYELIYYGSRTGTVFKNLLRGFAGSKQNTWSKKNDEGTIYVSNSVMAEHHNAIKDAIINIENNLGINVFPDATSLNGILKELEVTHLAPKALFRAYPLKSPSGTTISFQKLSSGNVVRYLWDFGDGTTSIERNPTHTYQSEGIYTVKLNVITETGSQGVTVKSNYITINDAEKLPFFYASVDADDPNTYHFIDQTDGEITQRFWVFDDGTNENIIDPDVHSTTHTYTQSGTYNPSLILLFSNQSLKRVFLSNPTSIIIS